MTKRTKALNFDNETRKAIYSRDMGCIFCSMNYRVPEETKYDQTLFSIMHYIPRSQGGLGVIENGAVGCQYHHHMLDNGNQGNRKEMLELFQDYLKGHYGYWDEKQLYYRKWN